MRIEPRRRRIHPQFNSGSFILTALLLLAILAPAPNMTYRWNHHPAPGVHGGGQVAHDPRP